MKLIGFIKEYDMYSFSEEYSKVIASEPLTISDEDKVLVLDYLKNSSVVFAWMGYFTDLETGAIVAPKAYHSDGHWIWPAYLPYIMDKFNIWKHYEDIVKYIIKHKHADVLTRSDIILISEYLVNKCFV